MLGQKPSAILPLSPHDLCPGHDEIENTCRDSTLACYLTPVPSPPTPLSTPPPFPSAVCFPPEIACHPDLDGTGDRCGCADDRPYHFRTGIHIKDFARNVYEGP